MSMVCPECGVKAKCKDSRPSGEGVRRRYVCFSCDVRWTTFESIVEGVRPGIWATTAMRQKLVREVIPNIDVLRNAMIELSK